MLPILNSSSPHRPAYPHTQLLGCSPYSPHPCLIVLSLLWPLRVCCHLRALAVAILFGWNNLSRMRAPPSCLTAQVLPCSRLFREIFPYPLYKVAPCVWDCNQRYQLWCHLLRKLDPIKLGQTWTDCPSDLMRAPWTLTAWQEVLPAYPFSQALAAAAWRVGRGRGRAGITQKGKMCLFVYLQEASCASTLKDWQAWNWGSFQRQWEVLNGRKRIIER